jgi:hypothetical protein
VETMIGIRLLPNRRPPLLRRLRSGGPSRRRQYALVDAIKGRLLEGFLLPQEQKKI